MISSPPRKEQRFNIRIRGDDLASFKARAEELGMPYQTLASSLLTQVARGRLVMHVGPAAAKSPRVRKKPAAKLFKAIAAVAANGVIGISGGGMPWHIPDEFRWFKEATLGQTLVMGRKTYETLKGPLPGRRTIVVSRTAASIPGVEVVRSLDAIDPAAYEGEVFIAGGAEIYRAAFPRCGELWLTILKQEAKGDVFFPPYEDQFRRDGVIREHPEFTVYRYVRKIS